MRTNDAGVDLIKYFEGLQLRAYLCPANVLTIGYGHTGPDVREGMQITEPEAERLLREDLRRFEEDVERLVTVPVNENEFSALVSLTYNIGPGNFKSSSCLKFLNAGDRQEAASRIELWNKATVNGERVVLEGLVRRRAAEKALFLTPVHNQIISVSSRDVEPDGEDLRNVKAYSGQVAISQKKQEEEKKTDERTATGVMIGGGAAAAATATESLDQSLPEAPEAEITGGIKYALRDFIDSLPDWAPMAMKVATVLALVYIAMQLLKRKKMRD